jgi:putative ABC transport system substrate-binding protein
VAAHRSRAKPNLPLMGLLSGRSRIESASLIAAFHKVSKEAGYVEVQNVAIEYRWAEGHYARLPPMAADLVGRHVVVMIATTGGTANGTRSRPR